VAGPLFTPGDHTVGVTDADADGDAEHADATASDAFQALGDEARLSTLVALLNRDDPASFSDLRAATGVEPSARFAYHLRQLTGRYVEQVDGGYRLTYAGRKVARAVAAGTYTDSVAFDADLDADCPYCGAAGLAATATDNVARVACEGCDRPVLSLPFPPRGYRDRDPDDVPAAFDRHHRSRLALMRDGVCPECGGRVETAVTTVGDPAEAGDATDAVDVSTDQPDGAERAVADLRCRSCGHGVRTPVALSLLEHPAVVAFYHDHGTSVRDRPLWNVGDEWRETVVSRDPLAVVVSVCLDGELLELYVDDAGGIVDHRRRPDGEGEPSEEASSDGSPAGEGDTPTSTASTRASDEDVTASPTT